MLRPPRNRAWRGCDPSDEGPSQGKGCGRADPGTRAAIAETGDRLPGAVRRLESRTNELAAAVHTVDAQLRADQMSALKQIREAQREMADEMRALEDQTAARDRQLHWVLARQAEQFHDLITDAASARMHRAA